MPKVSINGAVEVEGSAYDAEVPRGVNACATPGTAMRRLWRMMILEMLQCGGERAQLQRRTRSSEPGGTDGLRGRCETHSHKRVHARL